MTDLTCPSCGERERLTGRTVEDEIEVACSACGHRWLRGQRRCRDCGGVEQAVARQRMTTFPRGNQLAVIGMRDVPMCPLCDGDALGRLGDDRLLDDDYRSRFVSGSDAGQVAGRPPEPSRRGGRHHPDGPLSHRARRAARARRHNQPEQRPLRHQPSGRRFATP